jgi:hypothetical protein
MTSPEHEPPQPPGPAKEGIVLDREGNTLFAPEDERARREDPFAIFGSAPGAGRVRVYRGGWGLAAALGLLIPLVFVAGTVLFAIVAAMLAVAFVLRAIFGGAGRGSR